MTSDSEILSTIPYKEMLEMYKPFSLGYMGNDINNKFAIISLICYVTYKLKEKKPDVTHYSVLQSLTKDMRFPEDHLKALAVICDDMAYGCSNFPTFNINNKEIVPTIKKMLQDYVPF